MKLSVLLTVNDRPIGVLDAVRSSLKDQPYDEMIVVLDRVSDGLREYISKGWARWDERIRLVTLTGEPGWRSPVPAWNAAFKAATGDTLFAFSSEVVHAPQNVEVARRLLNDNPRQIVFGRCLCSCGPDGKEVNWGWGDPNRTAPGNLLVDSLHPRPLGFIWAGPLASVRSIGGMDPHFADGLAYDDDDFFFRLWHTGLDFTFTDEISGTHMHHERPVLQTMAGQQAMRRNAAYIIAKYGTINPWNTEHQNIIENMATGLTTWKHA